MNNEQFPERVKVSALNSIGIIVASEVSTVV